MTEPNAVNEKNPFSKKEFASAKEDPLTHGGLVGELRNAAANTVGTTASIGRATMHQVEGAIDTAAGAAIVTAHGVAEVAQAAKATAQDQVEGAIDTAACAAKATAHGVAEVAQAAKATAQDVVAEGSRGISVGFDSPTHGGFDSPSLEDTHEQLMRHKRNTAHMQDIQNLKKELRLQFSQASLKDVMDDPTDGIIQSGLKGQVHRVISSAEFDVAMGVVIIVNSLLIGLESTWELEGKNTAFLASFEHFFLLAYSAELAARFYANGLRCLRSGWVAFDLFLVSIGIITSYLLHPTVVSMVTGDKELGQKILMLRVFRLARLARTAYDSTYRRSTSQS